MTQTKKAIVFILIVGIIIAIDQLTKSFFSGVSVGTTTLVILPNVLDFTVVHNTGAAWGMFGDWTNIFVVIAFVVLIAIAFVVFLRGNSCDTMTVVSLSLLFAGGLGNAIDRVCQGYVIDFINFKIINFPVFNIADTAITFGVILLIINVLFKKKSA